MDYTDEKLKNITGGIHPIGGDIKKNTVLEGAVYTDYGGMKKGHSGLDTLINDYAKKKAEAEQCIFQRHPVTSYVCIFIVCIILLHLVMKPDGNIIDFFWQTLMYAKEVLIISWRFSIELFKAIFNFGDGLDVLRDNIVDVFELCHDYAEWVYTYFVG